MRAECGSEASEDMLLTPQGGLCWHVEPFSACFAHSLGSGLWAVATANWPWPAHHGDIAACVRRMMRQAVTKLAQAAVEHELASDVDIEQVIVPSPSELTVLCDQFPLENGGEYVTEGVIRSWHLALARHVWNEVLQRGSSVRSFIQDLGEPWNLVGRVFFHLAENKDDDGLHPFVFLVTYAHRTSESGQLKHLPLGSAMQAYAEDYHALKSILRPIKLASAESSLIKHLESSGLLPRPQLWTGAQARIFLHESGLYERCGIMVRIVNLWKKQPQKLQLSITVERSADEGGRESSFSIKSLLSFSVCLSLGGHRLSPEEVEALLASGTGLVRFNGEWVEVDEQRLRSLLDQWNHAALLSKHTGVSLVQGLRLLLGGKQALLPGLPPMDEDCVVEWGSHLAAAMDRLSEYIPPEAWCVSGEMRHVLRPYQWEGIRFLSKMTETGFGVCLADDMGLGKTLQCLGWISHLRACSSLQTAPVLIVTPASLLINWRDEAARFAPHLRICLYHPDLMDMPSGGGHGLHAAVNEADIVLTSYGMVTGRRGLHDVEFSAVVIDEAQAIKNADSQRARAVRELKASRRVALSGTPIENSLQDLWSLMEFLNPGLLGSRKSFSAWVRELKEDFSAIKQLIKPFILRRMKTDSSIAAGLPDKVDVPAYCQLTPRQGVLYKKEVEALFAVIQEQDREKRMSMILPFLMRFKQICDHPDLYGGGSEFSPMESGKMRRLEAIARTVAARHECMIVFTQFRAMIDPLHDLLAEVFGRAGLLLHGETPVAQRQELVKAFQSPYGPPFMILSLKAAGTGLTLTRANHVVHFDQWWNPAVENQATDRAYRIGQSKQVMVHRLLSMGTIEERVDRLLREKQALADEFFQEGIEKLLLHMSAQELQEWVAFSGVV